jgi:hypothetical protein
VELAVGTARIRRSRNKARTVRTASPGAARPAFCAAGREASPQVIGLLRVRGGARRAHQNAVPWRRRRFRGRTGVSAHPERKRPANRFLLRLALGGGFWTYISGGRARLGSGRGRAGRRNGVRFLWVLSYAGACENISGNMSKPEDELEQELRATMAAGLGSLLEDGDRVAIVTHSGGKFEGTIEDSNLSACLVRSDDNKLFFVTFAGIEHAEIFEQETTDDDPEGKEDEPAPVDDDGAPVTDISTARAS